MSIFSEDPNSSTFTDAVELCERMHSFSPLICSDRVDIYLPSRKEIIEIVEKLRSIIFPGFWGADGIPIKSLPYHIAYLLDSIPIQLKEQIKRGFCFTSPSVESSTWDCDSCEARAEEIVSKFMTELPELQRKLFIDARAAYNGDPASISVNECIYSYPGLFAITGYRIAHVLYKLDVPIIPRIITEHAHTLTGIDIHPGAEIGESFFIDHGTGVVIGETTIIGNNVRLYQGVTLGAKSFPLDENGNPVKGIPRHPIIEDNVVIYAGATVLGRITIGKDKVIGGNAWITKSVV